MNDDRVIELEAEIARAIGGLPRRYAREGYAQGLLLDLLERLGWRHEPLPVLELPDGGGCICGSRFRGALGRCFAAYHVQANLALATAASMALRAIDHEGHLAVA
jgi:hypothetical protein